VTAESALVGSKHHRNPSLPTGEAQKTRQPVTKWQRHVAHARWFDLWKMDQGQSTETRAAGRQLIDVFPESGWSGRCYCRTCVEARNVSVATAPGALSRGLRDVVEQLTNNPGLFETNVPEMEEFVGPKPDQRKYWNRITPADPNEKSVTDPVLRATPKASVPLKRMKIRADNFRKIDANDLFRTLDKNNPQISKQPAIAATETVSRQQFALVAGKQIAKSARRITKDRQNLAVAREYPDNLQHLYPAVVDLATIDHVIKTKDVEMLVGRTIPQLPQKPRLRINVQRAAKSQFRTPSDHSTPHSVTAAEKIVVACFEHKMLREPGVMLGDTFVGRDWIDQPDLLTELLTLHDDGTRWLRKYGINVNVNPDRRDRLRDEFFEPTEQQLEEWRQKYCRQDAKTGEWSFKQPTSRPTFQEMLPRYLFPDNSEEKIAIHQCSDVRQGERGSLPDGIQEEASGEYEGLPDGIENGVFSDDQPEPEQFAEIEDTDDQWSSFSRQSKPEKPTLRKLCNVDGVLRPLPALPLEMAVLQKVQMLSDRLDRRRLETKTYLTRADVETLFGRGSERSSDLGRHLLFMRNADLADFVNQDFLPVIAIKYVGVPRKLAGEKLIAEWEANLRKAGEWERARRLADKSGNGDTHQGAYRYYLPEIKTKAFKTIRTTTTDIVRKKKVYKPGRSVAPRPRYKLTSKRRRHVDADRRREQRTDDRQLTLQQAWQEAVNETFRLKDATEDGIYIMVKRPHQPHRCYFLIPAAEVEAAGLHVGNDWIHCARREAATRCKFTTRSMRGDVQYLRFIATIAGPSVELAPFHHYRDSQVKRVRKKKLQPVPSN
jgi:hypothetical protein